MLKRIFEKGRIFIFLILVSPGIWWVVLHANSAIGEWVNFPNYLSSNIKSIYREEKIDNVKTMRWANIDTYGWDNIISKVYYNKATIIVDELFSYLSFFSPRLFFHSGDGGNFSPPYVEPIPLILLPLFFTGMFFSLKKREINYFMLYLFFGLIAFMVGKKNMAYLLPVVIMTLFFVYKGILALNRNIRPKILWIIFLYCIFVGGRLLWLTLSRG